MFVPKWVWSWIHVISHSDYLTRVFSSSLSFDPVMSHLPPVSSSLSSNARTSSTSVWVMSNLYTSLSLCVFLYLPSILNQVAVAWAKCTTYQGITLPVCVPTSGLCFPAWLWLWSWPSMPYRSARRRKKKRGHPPTSWSQKQKVLFLRLILRRLNLWAVDINGIHEKGKTKGEKRWKMLQCEFVVHLMYC